MHLLCLLNLQRDFSSYHASEIALTKTTCDFCIAKLYGHCLLLPLSVLDIVNHFLLDIVLFLDFDDSVPFLPFFLLDAAFADS